MKRKALILLSSLIVSFCLVVAGFCLDVPKYGGVLRDSIVSNIMSLDPPRVTDVHSFQIASQIYEGLVSIGKDYKLRPSLAESWGSEGFQKWTFYLRNGVFFHDDPCFQGGKGRELTARDVKFSLERLLRPESKSPVPWLFTEIVKGAAEFYQGKADEVSGYRVVNEYTFQIGLLKPYANLPQRLTTPGSYIIPAEAVERYGDDLTKHPVGTGPFKLKELKPDSRIVLVKNRNYWQKDPDGRRLPYLEEIRVSIIKEGLTALSLFRQEALDSTPIPPSQYVKVVSKEGGLTKRYAGNRFQMAELMDDYAYAFTLTDDYLKNAKLRQAINYAVNKQEIVQYVLNGRGVVAKGVIPSGMPAFNPNLQGYRYDLEKARTLLAEAGYPNAKGLPELVFKVEAGEDHETVAVAIQSYLAKIGIKSKIEVSPINTIIGLAAQGKAQIFRWGWSALFPDPELFFVQFLSEKVPPQGFNFSRYKNSDFDTLYNSALKARSDSERNEIYHKMDEMVVKDAVWLFLYHPVVAKLDQPYVMNYRLDSLQRRNYKEVWINR